jgi:hypothetical protein
MEQIDFDFELLIYTMLPGSIVRTNKEIPVNIDGEVLILPEGSVCVVKRLVMGDVNSKAEQCEGLWEIIPDNSNHSWMAYGMELEIIFMIKKPKKPVEDWYDC